MKNVAKILCLTWFTATSIYLQANTNQQDQILYVGTYTDTDVLAHQPHSKTRGEGIYVYSLDKAGKLIQKGLTKVLNPAVLEIHPNKKMLYAISENIDSNGFVTSYKIGDDGLLANHGKYTASGKSTCYLKLAPNKQQAVIVSYWDAMIDVVSVDEDGALGENLQSFRQVKRSKYRQVTDREDHWKNRQVGPHAHSAHFWNNMVFIPDLGENSIFQYNYSDTKFLERDFVIPLAENSGPRHMVIHPKYNVAYVSNELKNTVVVAKLDKNPKSAGQSRFQPTQYISTIPKDFSATSYVSEVSMSPDKKFLYVSNRGHNSIAVFSIIDGGSLELVEITKVHGEFPRHFAHSPNGEFVLVANQDSSTITVFKRDQKQGGLRFLSKNTINVASPNYIKFL